MRRFVFSREHPLISSEDFLQKCTLRTKTSLPLEYEKIFRDTKDYSQRFSLPEPPKETAPSKKLFPIRTTRVKGLADDFYSSLLDWQGQNIVFALDERVFVQNFLTGRTSLVARLNSTYITSVKICPVSNVIGVGTCTGDAALIDMEGKILAKKHLHKSRIGVLEWNEKQMLTGSRDRSIKYMDPRSSEDTRSIIVHTQEVCGLAFSPCKGYLATGGNDNKVFIVDERAHGLVLHAISSHKAAVKAIGWCPERSDVLATGGGTADRTVKTWKVSGSVEKLIDSVDYGSQVCNLRWTRRNELITTHGYSQNDVRILNLGTHKNTKVFEGHKNRVIHFGMSTDEEYFATGSGDETLCIWRARENDLTNFLIR